MDRNEQWVKAVWRRMRSHLQSKKDRLYEEMRSYPTPIAGCDQQFNYLLEQRTAVAGEWARLNAAESESLAAQEPHQVIDAFVRSSTCLDAETKDAIRRYVQACLLTTTADQAEAFSNAQFTLPDVIAPVQKP